MAASYGHLEIAEIMLAKGADPNDIDKWSGQSALHLAAKNKHFDLFMLLLKFKAKENVEDLNGNTPLDYIVENWDKKLEQHILWKRGELDLQRIISTIDKERCKCGMSTIVQMLIFI